jgi:hypothetical protein
MKISFKIKVENHYGHLHHKAREILNTVLHVVWAMNKLKGKSINFNKFRIKGMALDKYCTR